MIHKLVPFLRHNDSLEILASAFLNETSLILNYKLQGNLNSIKLPKKNELKREIGLWETTCFEFFLLNDFDKSYYEFNFSPSGKWNCFFFKNQGDPLKEAECRVNNFECITEENNFEMRIELDMTSLGQSFRRVDEFKMNLTTVIDSDSLSYWALEHGKERPNFHDFKYYAKIKKSGNKPKLVT
ncbi:hypothetical protein [Halobacteriovorax sp.]|uniref:hypothetical protein n=1 Tax=Halobacteriovorax sp. TaxID=2020862 RepID=UPI00356503A9